MAHNPACDKKKKLLFSSFLMSFAMCGASLHAQTLEIKLVDGRNGHPMVGQSSYVNVWVGKERKEAVAMPTDSDGVARLRLTFNTDEVDIPDSGNRGTAVVSHPVMKYDEFFRINTPYVRCEPQGSNHSWLGLQTFSTKEVVQHGYVSANTCGKAAAFPQPGQVVLFVRPLTWWEQLKQ